MQLKLPDDVRIGDYTFAKGIANVENPAHIDRMIALGAEAVEEEGDDAAEAKKKQQLDNLVKARAAKNKPAAPVVAAPVAPAPFKAEKP